MSAEGGGKGAGAVAAGGVVAPCVVGVGNDGCACAVQNSGDVTLEIGCVVIGSAVVGDGLGCAGRVVGEIQGIAVHRHLHKLASVVDIAVGGSTVEKRIATAHFAGFAMTNGSRWCAKVRGKGVPYPF